MYFFCARREAGLIYRAQVKRVTVRGPWAALGGLRLVDAPGVLDDNEARSRAVRAALSSADSVLFASNVRRAVNDKSIADALPLAVRKTLAETGKFGAVALVATQNDLVNAQEITESLKLPEDASRRACAAARATFTRTRAAETFWDGLPWQSLPVNRDDSSFDYPVFVASAVECQKLEKVRARDGPPTCFEETAETDLPQLRAFLSTIAAAPRGAGPKAGALVLEALVRAGGGEKRAADDPEAAPSPKRARPEAAVPAAPRSPIVPSPAPAPPGIVALEAEAAALAAAPRSEPDEADIIDLT